MLENILVVGGAGYIGSYMCKYLSKSGFRPIVLDDLSTGHREAVRWGPFYEAAISDDALLNRIFSENTISAVMHFAACCYVGESVNAPAKYYLNNVASTIHLLDAMLKNKVNNFIFSSSCATYGEPNELPITETHPQCPINPYGWTKLMVEKILDDYRDAYGFKYVTLRYFNAAGADPDGEIGEDHSPETHIIPLTLQTALGQRDAIHILGDDYPTRDGSCVRDYIHIADLASAHLLSLERLLNDSKGGKYNLGNGDGFTVKEVIAAAREITARDIPSKVHKRRPGDPAILIGSSEKARKELGWRPQYGDIQTIIETAWNWHRNHPNGYASE